MYTDYYIAKCIEDLDGNVRRTLNTQDRLASERIIHTVYAVNDDGTSTAILDYPSFQSALHGVWPFWKEQTGDLLDGEIWL